VDNGARAGVPTEVTEKMKAMEREIPELRHSNEILRKASAYFGMAELDRCVRYSGVAPFDRLIWPP